MEGVAGLPGHSDKKVMLNVFKGLLEVDKDFSGLVAMPGCELGSDRSSPRAVPDPPARSIIALGWRVGSCPCTDFTDTGLHVHADKGPKEGYGPETSILFGDQDSVDNGLVIWPGTGLPQVAQEAKGMKARIGKGCKCLRGKAIRG
jgi:hypothetical protein